MQHNFLSDQQLSEMEERYHSLHKIIKNDMQALINEVKAYKELQSNMKDAEIEKTTNYDILSEYPLFLDPTDIQKILGIGKNQAYNLVNSGKFRIKRIGQLIKIPKESFVLWYDSGD